MSSSFPTEDKLEMSVNITKIPAIALTKTSILYTDGQTDGQTDRLIPV